MPFRILNGMDRLLPRGGRLRAAQGARKQAVSLDDGGVPSGSVFQRCNRLVETSFDLHQLSLGQPLEALQHGS